MVEYSRSSISKINSSFVIVPTKRKKKTQEHVTFQVNDMLNLGIYLVVPLLAGLGLGILIDNKMGTRPWGTLSGLVFGVVGSFFNLIKIVRPYLKHA